MKADRLFATWIFLEKGKVSARFDANSIASFIKILDRGSDLEISLDNPSKPHLVEDIYVELNDYNEIKKAMGRGEI